MFMHLVWPPITLLLCPTSPHLYQPQNMYMSDKMALQRPYSGPNAVLTPGDKTFLMDIGSHAEHISVDCIKPVFFNPFQPVILTTPPPLGCLSTKQSHPSCSHPSDPSTTSKNQQTMSGPAVQTSSRTGCTIRPSMRYQ